MIKSYVSNYITFQQRATDDMILKKITEQWRTNFVRFFFVIVGMHVPRVSEQNFQRKSTILDFQDDIDQLSVNSGFRKI